MTKPRVQRNPTPNYSIELPSTVMEDYEDRVSSFWMADDSLALQISTYLRTDRENGSAAEERLRERMRRSSGTWRPHDIPLRNEIDYERAAASVIDEEGVMWVHAYFTWPDFAIYATLSGKLDEVRSETNWAFNSLRSIRRRAVEGARSLRRA